MKFNTLFLPFMVFVTSLMCLSASAQHISYSEPERDDTRRTNFEIIGKVGNNILIFKNNRSQNDISVYDNDMKLLNRVELNYMNDKWINVDFIPYPDHATMIYQYQRKNVVYCMAVKLDQDGKRLTDPVELDTTRIGWSANDKIYTTSYSDDKQKVMIFKINSKNQSSFLFSTFLYNADLQLIESHRLSLPMEEKNDYFTDFLLDNQGGLMFGKYSKKNGNDYITGLKIVHLKPGASDFAVTNVAAGDRILDEVKVKIDNTGNRVLFTAFYYKQKRGNIDGIFTAVYDKKEDKILKMVAGSFNDDLRRQAKGPDANLKLAFNDYFIKNILIKKDGGVIFVGESLYTSSRGNAFNRWDYLGYNNPWNSPLNYYYSPYYSPWGSPWNRYGTNTATRYHSENIMILSFDNQLNLEWSNVIPKSQFDDDSDAMISHQTIVTGGELHFLFNQYERRTLLLSDQSIGVDGKITRYPTLKNLDRGFEFMPRLGKQVSGRSIVMPCQYKNYLTFAKLDF